MAEIYNVTEKIKILDSCLRFLTPNSTVLEFGSATGYYTRFMKEELGCEVTCIEKVPAMAEIGRKIAKKMIVANLECDEWEKELQESTFDYIIFADILEHLTQPEIIIKKAVKLLKDNGYILTSIPNIGHNAVLLKLRDAEFDYNETGLLDNTHIHFFTKKSIFDLFARSHLYCVEEQNKLIRPCDTELESYYANHPLFALSLISKPDGHVYRFVHKWSKNPIEEKYDKSIALPLHSRVWELFYDTLCRIKRKRNLSTPTWVGKIFHRL
ncbi:MAG: class I SAM-dependent methyltransferase [Paludibacteraceae bacterium]